MRTSHRTLLCLVPLVLLAPDAWAAQAGLPSMNFQSSPPPELVQLAPVPDKPGRMLGAIPRGWRDDSAWAEVSGEYLPEEFEGTRYLRVQVDSVQRGVAQLAAQMPGAQVGQPYEIRISLRAPKPITFSVTIRQDGPPYREFWRGEVRASSTNFETVTLEVPALSALEKPLLMLGFSHPGIVDIRDLSIVPTKPEETGPVEAQNLLRISRFPLGPQNGMSLYREVSDDTCTFDSDPLVWGPSGVPALRVTSGDYPKFYFDGELIQGLRRGQPHTASVWIKGNGTLILSAMSAREGGTKLEKERFFRIRPENGWQRALLSFQSARDTPNQFLRFAIRGCHALLESNV